MIIVKSDIIYVPKNYNVTGMLRFVVKDRATDEEIVFDNLGDDATAGSSDQPSGQSLLVGSYHILTMDAGRLEPSTEYEYTLIHKDTEKIIGRGLLRTE